MRGDDRARAAEFGIEVDGARHRRMRLAVQANAHATLRELVQLVGDHHVPEPVIGVGREWREHALACRLVEALEDSDRTTQIIDRIPAGRRRAASGGHQVGGLDAAETPAGDQALLEEWQASPDHVGDHEQQGRQ